MNMKNIRLLILILICGIGYSQEVPTELPNIIGPSPSVASLMKFEEVPVNNYTGIPDISIPLYSVESLSKDVSLNLSLNYHPSSIAVDEVAGYTGLGWNLFAGGTISRTVRGLPDEINKEESMMNRPMLGIYHSNNPIREVMNMLPVNAGWTQAQRDTFNKFLWESHEKGAYDSQYDLYQFNFMGHTGRFYVHKNSIGQLEVVKLDNDKALDIQLNYSTGSEHKLYDFNNFTIYDDKGYKYVFEAKEITIQSPSQEHFYFSIGGTYANMDPYQKSFISAFHLTEIFDPNNNKIVEFQYYENYPEISKSVTSTYRVLTNLSDTFTNLLSLEFPEEEYRKLLPKVSHFVSLNQVMTQKIKKITVLGKANILFKYTKGRQDYNLLDADDSYWLDSIEIYDGNIKKKYIKKYVFEYDYVAISKSIPSGGYIPVDNKRMVLKKVKEFNDTGTQYLDYEMFYRRVLPATVYTDNKKDYWGYLTTNSNRETNPIYCLNDVLESIKLPTGGVISYTFESNTYSHIGSTEISDYYQNPDNWDTTTGIYIFQNISPNNVKDLGSSSKERYVTFEPNSPLAPGGGTSNSGSFTLRKHVGNSVIVVANINCVGTNYINDGTCTTPEIILEPGVTYSVMFQWLNLEPTQATLKVTTRTKKEENQMAKHLYGGGVRIKNISFYESTKSILDSPLKEKKYNYSFFNDSSKSSGSLVFGKPIYTYNEYKKHFFIKAFPENPYVYTDVKLLEATYRTTTNVNNLMSQRTHGADVGYMHVTVYETGNGKSEYLYDSPINEPEESTAYSLNPPFLPSRNFDYRRGLLRNEKHYNQTSKLLSEIIYNYSFDENYEGKFTGLHLYVETGCPYSFFFELYPFYKGMVDFCANNDPMTTYEFKNLYCLWQCGEPSTYIFFKELRESYGWAKLISKTTKNYFYEGSIQSSMSQTETFTYNNNNKKLAEHSITNSLGETLKTKYYYDLNHANRNRIGVIKKIETYRNSTLLETKEINYVNTFTGNSSYLPETVSVSKGTNNPLESRIRYIRYNEYGNPLEVKQENGIHIVYLWGYDKAYPIAKIENATYSQVTSALGTTTISENNLMAIDNLRNNSNFSNSLITTYTYKPLVGITSITDSRGYKTTYQYDSFGRLEFVKDAEGNILEENKYNYRP